MGKIRLKKGLKRLIYIKNTTNYIAIVVYQKSLFYKALRDL